jgi:DNA-binding PadR family transcriptional regulator
VGRAKTAAGEGRVVPLNEEVYQALLKHKAWYIKKFGEIRDEWVEQGSLYPARHRLIKRGWISAEEGTSENNRRAKFYKLTTKGRRQLAVETSKWDKLAGAIARILRPAEQKGE